MALDTSKEIRNLVIYQIFTRNYKEGTFRAVEEDLDRIRDLGVDYIYLLPIHPSGKVNRKGSMGSPYAISDYRAVDSVQGTMEDFVRLTEKVHAAGMKILIDVVYNHTAPDSVLAKEHPEWFYHKPDGSFGNHVGDWWDVIDLDYTTSRELWRYQIDTLKMWAKYVDGFRCDVAPLISLEFWKQAREEVAAIRPGCLWLAESTEAHFIRYCRKMDLPALSDGELYQAFDILYDYDSYPLFTDLLHGKGSLDAYLRQVNSQETTFPDNFSKLRCLENHDRPRAATLFPEEKILRNWTAWSYFATGTTMLYAGQEFCAQHHPTLFDRDTVDFATGRDITPFLRRLARVKKSPMFSLGDFQAEAIGQNHDVILAVRERPAAQANPLRKCYGIFSTTGARQVLKVDLPDGVYINILDGKSIDVFEKTFLYEGDPIILIIPPEED